MSKKLQDLTWKSVELEGFPISQSDKFQGFVGLEECTTYNLDKQRKPKKNKIEKKNKQSEVKKKNEKKRKMTQILIDVPTKKIKLNNGFIVENIKRVNPSKTNSTEITEKHEKPKTSVDNFKTDNNKSESKDKKIFNKKKKIGELMTEKSNLTPEDMLSWAEFKLPEEIMKALMELGFQKPTKIQQLSLPAAIHGRRDILGAAETGSGKTLAFGLPILLGIMKLKEKSEMGVDVYDLPYKKSSTKKCKQDNIESKKNKTKETHTVKNKRNNLDERNKAKESSEEGYGSANDDESNIDSEDSVNEKQGTEIEVKTNLSEVEKDAVDDEDFIEEIEVPFRKSKDVDEESDSDNSESNYVHLSDMLDSDDLADKSSDEEELHNSDNDEVDDTRETNEEGIGCVKVINNIEIPQPVVKRTGKPLYALILTPTRELAIQISNHLKAVAKYTGIRVATIVGGMAAVKQERLLRAGPEVVVATPGRLWEMFSQGQEHLQQLPYIRFLAIDETDRMVERGHFIELQPLLERINSDTSHSNSRQNFVFSATLTVVHDLPSHMRFKKVTKGGKIINRKIEKMTSQLKLKRLIDMIGMTEPKVVDITKKNLGTAETLTESRIPCSLEDKDVYLYYILKVHPGRTIVFCNSINSVKRLAELLSLLKCRPLPLHANMAQKQRLKNLERFRDDLRGILVATDVAARGLDIPNVDHVIHYQVPRTAENYVHRSGRTARATKEGLTIIMMEPAEAYLYSKLCKTLNKETEPQLFPTCVQSLPAFRRLVHAARDLLALQQRWRKSHDAVAWREKVARELDIIIDDDVVPVKQVDPHIEKAVAVKKRELDSLLNAPMFPRGFSYKYPTLNNSSTFIKPEENALQAIKNAIVSGELKKDKRKSKNESVLKLEKEFAKKTK